jgi:eukaryotic-like serine/threonine-protein kinase
MTEEMLFIEALEIPDPVGRARFLDWACAGDAALRARLDRLIGRHERAGEFPARPAAALPDAD